MAAKETVNGHETNVESVVNRWIVDYYLFLALELFQKEQYEDFCSIRNVLDSVLVRPLESMDSMPAKIRVLQFLSRINEGEKLDLSFETDQSTTPLESALLLLENMSQEFSIPQQDFENVCASIKEMIVGIFIKNNEFDKAKEVLKKHFPKPMIGKKAIFMGLCRQKSKIHEVIEQINFRQFKEEMLAFCQRLCPFSMPFLHKAASELLDRRLTEQSDKAVGTHEEDDEEAGTDEQSRPDPSSTPQVHAVQFIPCKHLMIQKTRLKMAYMDLAAGANETTFAQLREQVEEEEREDPKTGAHLDSEQEGLFQRDPGSLMETKTDAVPQTQAGSLSRTPPAPRGRQQYSVALLVVEPDSQPSSQCTTASQEAEVRTEKAPQPLAISTTKDLQCPLTDREVAIPIRKRPRQANRTSSRASTSLPELSADSDEDSGANREMSDGEFHNQSNGSFSRRSKSKQLPSDSEEELSASRKTPVRTPHKQQARDALRKDPGDKDEFHITDTSLDTSPNLFPLHPVPQTSSTPHKTAAPDERSPLSKWKKLYNNAKESKDTWSDEETVFASKNSSGSQKSTSSKRKWTEAETQKLIEGVQKFGEGNWSKIKAYYAFKNRTNVNLKDRWRTVKKLNLV